jgi:hypothetical protein
MFSNVHALVIGMIGAAWRLAPRGAHAATDPVDLRSISLAGKRPAFSTSTVQSAGG